jgi:hypothetical protein
MTETATSFQSSWTLAEALIIDISSYQRLGRSSWMNGNLEKYFWSFEAIVRILYGMITDEEKKTAKNIEGDILKLLKDKDKKKGELSTKLKEYDGLVMTLIHNHHLDVPPKRDRTRLVG